MKDKELRKLLEFKADNDYVKWIERIDKIEHRLDKIESELFVPNYFHKCPCCSGEELIARSKAKEFKKPRIRMRFISNREVCFADYETFHTTPESYEAHKSQIKKWEQEVKSLK